MVVTADVYGFKIEVVNENGSKVVLTFEEVWSPRTGKLAKYECYVDFINMVAEINDKGLIVKRQKVTKSFVIKDWFCHTKELRKRNELKNKLGYKTFEQIMEYSYKQTRREGVKPEWRVSLTN
ncbi:hypothetical protein P9X10_01055 [Bacillus cereus]|nr:hypothetical protein [Bacillus cereus]